MASIFDWRDLPYREIWCIDTEFYPGSGLANGGREGDPITPLCLCGRELRSGRALRLWQSELGVEPPFSLGPDSLIVAHALPAEFGVFRRKGWPEPAAALDTLIEFRHCTNNGMARSEDRPKGFYSLAGALRYFLEDELDAAAKDAMRERIMQGPPFDGLERRILDYCMDDADGVARLLPHLIPTIRSLPHALFRGKFAWVSACQQNRGVPIDGIQFEQVKNRWSDIQLELVRERDAFGFYEIVSGKPHFREARFDGYLRQHGLGWPRRADGTPDLKEGTFRDMSLRYPQFETVRELRYSLSKLRLNKLEIGTDFRNRTPLWPYSTKTGRNAPSNSGYIFGPAKWLRFFIAPPAGRVLVHRDYSQQEVRIAAVLSGDGELLAACESGDVYSAIATQLGFMCESMDQAEREAVRALFKQVVLGILYGLGPYSLALRTGISLAEAGEILARLKARFHKFEAFAAQVADHAGLELELRTPFGWVMQCPSGTRKNLLRNFCMQSGGSEILHVACILAERRGIEIIAPVHDALMAEGPLEHVAEISAALDRTMRDAAAIVLRGYELPTDQQIIRPGETYYDKRGVEMWTTVTKLVARLEQAA
jgi:hypothetical protein